MKVTYEDICTQTFKAALNKVSNHHFPVKTGYNISRLVKVLDKETKNVQELWAKIEDATEYDEVLNDDGTVKGKKPKDMEAFKAKEKETLALEFEVEDRWALDLEEIEAAQLTPNDILVLEPLMKEVNFQENLQLV